MMIKNIKRIFIQIKEISRSIALNTTVIIVAILVNAQLCIAGSDLDDDISKYKDSPIEKWDELGKKSVNINFIIVEALSMVDRTDKTDKYINSVVIGPGSNVGDIFNIHFNEPVFPTPPKDEDENNDEDGNNHDNKKLRP